MLENSEGPVPVKNYNYGNASWNLTYSTGQGGMFTSAGKILTFWYR